MAIFIKLGFFSLKPLVCEILTGNYIFSVVADFVGITHFLVHKSGTVTVGTSKYGHVIVLG